MELREGKMELGWIRWKEGLGREGVERKWRIGQLLR
jgi:hypothetical protein